MGVSCHDLQKIRRVQPHELDALTAAYDAVWQEVQATLHIKAIDASVLKNNLAQIILASACTGKRDAERLKQIALRAVLSKQGMQS